MLKVSLSVHDVRDEPTYDHVANLCREVAEVGGPDCFALFDTGNS